MMNREKKKNLTKNICLVSQNIFLKHKWKKKIISYKYLIEEIHKLEITSNDSTYKHVLSKKVLLNSKNAKGLCRSGVQFKHIRDVLLKMFNVEFSKEDYENKKKDVFKGRSLSDLEEQCPSFTDKTFEESLPFHYLNEKGINALKEVAWLLNGVIPKIEYCPTLLSVASLLLLFLSKEETYEILRNIIESDQNLVELNKLRWHFRYTLIENVKLELSIKTCILDLSKDNTGIFFRIIEEMGLPMYELVKDMSETFFLDYINFLGVIKFLPFFLLEGVKGIYRLIYAIVSSCSLTQEAQYYVPKRDPNQRGRLETLKHRLSALDMRVQKRPKEEVIKIFKEKSNKIEKFFNLIEIATQWKLTHLNNNYSYQFIPSNIRDNLPKLDKLLYIPYFTPESKIIEREEIPKLWELIPSDIKYCNGILLFDKEKHPECNLNTIYQFGEKLDSKSKIFFLVQTIDGEVFGGIMDHAIKLHDNVQYITPSTSFLFTVRPEIKVYEPKDKVHDEIVCFEPGAIRFGYGRDGAAITINYSLQEGSTEKNTVFGNDICLINDYSNEGIFQIKGLEIYLMQ